MTTLQKDGAHSAWRYMFVPRLFMLGVFGVFCLLLSIALEQGLVIHEMQHPNLQSQIRVVLWYQNPWTYVALFRELGIAAFIALVVSALIDRTARVEQQARADAAMELALGRVARNMFEAAFSLRTPTTIVQHVIDTILTAPVVRIDHHVTLKIGFIPNEQAKRLKLTASGYRLLTVTSRSEYQNVTPAPVEWRFGIEMSVDRAAPELSRVNFVHVSENALSVEDIDAGFLPVSTEFEKTYNWTQTIEPGDTLSVVICYQKLKHASDNEVLRSSVATETARYTIDVECDDLYWSIASGFSGELVLQSGEKTKDKYRRIGRSNFVATAPVLNNQGIVFWWGDLSSPMALPEIAATKTQTTS